jgi:hypothetical protein
MNRASNGEIDEASWIKTYMELSGATESQARSVFMYVGCREPAEVQDDDELEVAAANQVAQSNPLMVKI